MKSSMATIAMAVFSAAGVSAGAVADTLAWHGDSDLEALFPPGGITHAVCFSKGKGVVRVGNVAFEKTTERDAWHAKRQKSVYRVCNLEQLFGGKQPATTKVRGEGAKLLNQFLHSNLGRPGRLELGGLVPGQPYRLVVFTQGWDNNPYVRIQLASSPNDPVDSVDGGKVGVVAPNRFGKRMGALIVVDYTADAQGRFSIRFDPLDDPMSIHLAAFANFRRDGQ